MIVLCVFWLCVYWLYVLVTELLFAAFMSANGFYWVLLLLKCVIVSYVVVFGVTDGLCYLLVFICFYRLVCVFVCFWLCVFGVVLVTDLLCYCFMSLVFMCFIDFVLLCMCLSLCLLFIGNWVVVLCVVHWFSRCFCY